MLDNLDVGTVSYNVAIKKYTTYKLDGTIKTLVVPDNTRQLINVIKYAKENNIKYKVIGNGSNLIFADDFDGIIIKLDNFNHLEIIDNFVVVGAGYSLPLLALNLSKEGYSGLEFAAGIPGTVGGSIFNNAGAYKSDMAAVVKSILVLTPDLEIKRLSSEDLKFNYRTSFLKDHPDYICLEAIIKLIKGHTDVIMEVIDSRKKRRMETQPLDYPSAGSIFRNSDDFSAWKLIDGIGYKGKQIGDAKVSEKHANFIINVGNAKGKDVIKLIDEIKEKVKEKYDIELVLEQEIVK